jgi:hypothetical protein
MSARARAEKIDTLYFLKSLGGIAILHFGVPAPNMAFSRDSAREELKRA